MTEKQINQVACNASVHVYNQFTTNESSVNIGSAIRKAVRELGLRATPKECQKIHEIMIS